MIEQLSLWQEEETTTPPQLAPNDLEALLATAGVSTEPQSAYERRRVAEMAAKIGWPALVIEPWRNWAGADIADGETAWRAFLGDASPVAITWVLIALQKQLDPLTREGIDEKTGLKKRSVEVISQMEERNRTRLLTFAEALNWPRVTYYAAGETWVMGPGEEIWRRYAVYGCTGTIADALGALERRLQGEPDKVKKGSSQLSDDEE